MRSITRRMRAWLGLPKSSPQRDRNRRRLALEMLEQRAVPASTLHLDFGVSGSPVATGYTGFTLQSYNATRGYGWKSTGGMAAADRFAGNDLTRDLHRGSNSQFLADVPNGVYDITFTLGDTKKGHDRIELRAEGQILATNVATQTGETWVRTYQVQVTDGQLNIRLIDRGGSDRYFAINALDIVPHAGPTANAGADQTANEAATVNFSGTASGDGPLSYHWDFGDGGTADGSLTTSHAFADNGQYNVSLTVTDVNGLTTSDVALVTVNNVVPSADHHGPYSGSPGTNVTFTGTATDPSSVDTAAGFTWAWNFGDGVTSTQRTPTHAYATPGTYTVTFSATDKDGGKHTVTTTATITSSSGGEDWIQTPHDKVPNYGKNASIVSVVSGNWSSPATWSLGRLPQAGDVVAIMPGTVVTYDVSSTTKLGTVQVRAAGELTFRTDVSTKMVVANLMVLEGGTLEVGTAAQPIAANVTAEIIIASQAINTAFDPQQYGTSLLGWGTVTMHGAARSASFVRLAAEPQVGHTTLTLSEAAVGWKPGDRLFLPDSRQLRDSERGASYVPQWEEPVIQSISADGKTITLTAGLKFNHPGSRNANGTIEFLPHVGNLSRNVVLRSENPTGTRGHVQFFHDADVDVRYVQFRDLGRTTNQPLDNTTFNSDGSVSHIGTNQIGRYPLHLHHVIGPHDAQANGFQFTLIGNAIDGGTADHNRKWGIALHDSHYGLVRDNAVWNVDGSGIVTEDGSESYNLIERNFVARVQGTGNRLDAGRDGVAFWFRGPNNYVRDNVAASIGADGGSGAASYGFNYFMYFLGNVVIPSQQGEHADTTVDGNALPILEFVGNEVYGATPSGLTFWHIGTLGDWPNNKMTADSVFKDFKAWNFYDYGTFAYPSDRVVFDGWQIRGDPAIAANPYEYITGISFSDYPTRNVVMKNMNIQGMQTGIETPYVAPGTTTIRDSYLRNVTDISHRTMYSVNGSASLPAKKTVLTNVRFDALPGLNHVFLDMEYDTGHGNNLIQKDEVFIYDFNGTAGLNYRVYYDEQKADYLVPKTSGSLIGSPEAGLTNQQNWAKYGIAIGGAIAPSNASKRSEIKGLIVQI